MNPLPNRPLLSNSSAPLSLPNVPSFDQIAYNGRPRKVLPEGGKEFPLLNGISTMTGSPSAGTANGAPQLPLLERNGHVTSALGSHQPPQSTPGTGPPPSDTPSGSQLLEKGTEIDPENRQLTAIFRPDDAGEWREKLRQSREAAEKVKLAREFAQSTAAESGSWERAGEEEEIKEDESEVDDEESSLIGEGEDSKLWKAKRTLRKLVDS